MTVQDYIIAATTEAMDEAFRYARATDPEKLDWKPLDQGRSVLEQCRELAQCPDWAHEIIKARAFDMSGGDSSGDQRSTWSTLDDCEKACKEKLAAYFAYIAEIPAEELTDTVNLPFGPGGSIKTFTIAELMEYPRWNATYHLGQIAYIQSLYGDKAMH